ncbi:MAG: hypothetical protein KGN76_01570 [Acidobacteriota bacterium]|nr:hypothetical protein [Acidobacteriota bacterium]
MNARQPVETPETVENRRNGTREPVALPGYLTWRDARGTTRFVGVRTRNISDFGVFVECETPAAIPLFRLVTLQLEGPTAQHRGIPDELRAGKVTGAIYRAVPADPARGRAQGYAVRLLIEPRRRVVSNRPSRRYLRAVRSIA